MFQSRVKLRSMFLASFERISCSRCAFKSRHVRFGTVYDLEAIVDELVSCGRAKAPSSVGDQDRTHRQELLQATVLTMEERGRRKGYTFGEAVK